MGNRTQFYEHQLKLDQIVDQYSDVENSLRDYFNANHPQYPIRFVGYTVNDVNAELQLRQSENNRATTLTILSFLEASFRIDYLQRCYLKKKDKLSRAFREIHKHRGSRARFEEDILEGWKQFTTVSPSLIGEVCGVWNYRNWLAHGRYWVPKLGQRYDYDDVYTLVEEILIEFPFESLT